MMLFLLLLVHTSWKKCQAVHAGQYTSIMKSVSFHLHLFGLLMQMSNIVKKKGDKESKPQAVTKHSAV